MQLQVRNLKHFCSFAVKLPAVLLINLMHEHEVSALKDLQRNSFKTPSYLVLANWNAVFCGIP